MLNYTMTLIIMSNWMFIVLYQTLFYVKVLFTSEYILFNIFSSIECY